jgi:hypothetical protein
MEEGVILEQDLHSQIGGVDVPLPIECWLTRLYDIKWETIECNPGCVFGKRSCVQ